MATSALMPTTMPSIARLARSLLTSRALTAFAKISRRSMSEECSIYNIHSLARRAGVLPVEIGDQAVRHIRHYSVNANRNHPRELVLSVGRPYIELLAIRPRPRGQVAVAKLDLHA